jgi:cytochrome c-type biogenesis protein
MMEIPLVLMSATFVAGILMFLAPCTLPLVPAYLALISGAEASDGISKRQAIMRNALAFVVGFGTMFVLFGALAAFLGASLVAYREILTTLGGVLVIVFALAMLGVFRLPGFNQVATLPLPKQLQRGSPGTSLLLGSSIAIGWTPCVGPVLATVFVLASSAASFVSGVVLLIIFVLGFSLPFLLLAYTTARTTTVPSWLMRLSSAVQYVGGLLLLYVGYLLLTDSLGILADASYIILDVLGLGFLINFY